MTENLDAYAPDWADVLRRAHAGTRRRLVLATAATLALLAVAAVAGATAFGAIGSVVDWFTGTPAPPTVQQNFLQWNAQAQAANYAQAQAGLTKRFPLVDATHVQGEVAVQTPDGPLYLWAAPTTDGGHCWLMQFGSEQIDGFASGHGSCDDASQPSALWAEDWWVARHPELKIVDGRVATNAVTVEVDLASGGPPVRLQVVDGYFLGTVDASATIASVTAYDASGNVVATERMVQ
jgi:hypothetical protein